MSLHIVGRAARQENRCAADIGGVAPASFGDTLHDLAVAGLVGLQSRGVVGGDIARRDRVHVDALGRPLVGQQLGQAAHPAFRGGVARHADAALESQHGSDVDDLAARAVLRRPAGHVPRDGLAEEEQNLQVHIHHRVPVLLREIERILAPDDPGIVDQNVDPPQRVDRLVDDPLARLDGGKVRHDDMRTDAFGLHHRLCFIRTAPCSERDIRPRLRQRDGDALPYAGVGAGNQRHLAREIERLASHDYSPRR